MLAIEVLVLFALFVVAVALVVAVVRHSRPPKP